MTADSTAIVFERPGNLAVRDLKLEQPKETECVVEIECSGISTGTERLLWNGEMPPFPGMGYPLVPGYEAIGRVISADSSATHALNQKVFVPGANCYKGARGLFGASSSKLVVDAQRIVPLEADVGEEGVLLALAATAYHALHFNGEKQLPELIIGYGVLGRLLARLVIVLGGKPPVVWEKNLSRSPDDGDIKVIKPADDSRFDYGTVCDVSGDSKLLDTLIQRLRPGGEVVLAGFYSQALSFDYPPAFMREARIRVAAEWKPHDLVAVNELLRQKKFSLDGLITHRKPFTAATEAYQTAFNDPECLKMIINWRN